MFAFSLDLHDSDSSVSTFDLHHIVENSYIGVCEQSSVILFLISYDN